MAYAKSIDTLVDDIYALFTRGSEPSEDLLQHCGKTMAENLGESLSRGLSKRDPKLRLSAIGKPSRQLFYELSGAPKEPYTGSTLIKFQYGHLLEEMILYLAKEAGHTVEDEQMEINCEGIIGHQDCLIDGVLVDVKSASPYGFKKFKDGSLRENDSFNYIPQLASYQQGRGKNEDGAFLVINKVTGELCICKFSAEELSRVDISGHVERQKKVSAQVQEQKGDLSNPPERCFDPVSDKTKADNLVLSTECSYCAFKSECWKDSNNGWGLRAFSYYSGPRYFVDVKKEPRVHELSLEDIYKK